MTQHVPAGRNLYIFGTNRLRDPDGKFFVCMIQADSQASALTRLRLSYPQVPPQKWDLLEICDIADTTVKDKYL